MSTSEDEYDTQLGGAIKLSAEDCAKIDALGSDASLQPRTMRVTHIDVELETPQTSIHSGVEKFATSPPVTSPFQRYRPGGRLSVTDLVAPAWQVYWNKFVLRALFTRTLGVKFSSNMGFNNTGQKG